MIQTILTIIIGYITIIIGDFVWLGYVTKGFIIREFGNLVVVEAGSIKINLLAGLTAWFVIVLLVYVFVIRSGYATSYMSAVIYGSIMGFLSYAMYDLTNLTFIRGYSFLFTVVDIFWGTFLCGMVACVMYAIHKYFLVG
ncbi:MAG: DUF2177 family protein [Candidatus Altimarinota bacterium]